MLLNSLVQAMVYLRLRRLTLNIHLFLNNQLTDSRKNGTDVHNHSSANVLRSRWSKLIQKFIRNNTFYQAIFGEVRLQLYKEFNMLIYSESQTMFTTEVSVIKPGLHYEKVIFYVYL